MAILFTTDTINQPDAGSVGLAMAERIRDDVAAHPAWELVEEFTAGSGLARWYVFKCLPIESGLPNDFFVIMGRTLSSGELKFAIAEEYNSDTHTMSKYTPAGTSTSVNFDVNGCAPNAYVLGTAAFPGSVGTPKSNLTWTPSGTSTKWWIAVAEDGFTVAFNGAANSFVHIGAYISLSALYHPMPIQIIASSNTEGGITNNPAVAGESAPMNALTIQGGGGGSASGQTLGFAGDFRYNDKLQDNLRPVAELGINMVAWTSNPNYMAVYGWALGKQKRMRIGGSGIPAGISFGDAYSLDGRLWVPYLPTDSRIWDTGVASS